ncbi:MAG: hypothetical protein WC729_05355 [Sphingomonas sp.]|jgi:hypothetical protein|uniref:hypothetical protein n=1 Tax=Sphingomonas sp. TaxID=28214 RepID=UPI003564E3A5
MPIEAYKALDVGMNSSAANALFSRADDEASATNLHLTGDGDAGAMSAHLTQAMNAWLNAEVAPARGAAITSIKTAASQILLPGGVHGIVPEFEKDRLKRDRNTRRVEVHNTFHDRHGADVEKQEETEREYEAMRAYEGGRKARNPGRLIDFLVIVLIMVPESFINYRYFLEYLKVGIVALGSTIIVGLLFGASAYLAGRFWKAYYYYMAPDNDRQRAEGVRMIILAMGVLFIALMAVGAVRYMGIVRDNVGRILIGQPPLEPFSQTGMLLFGNLGVFALGMALTYWLHDKNPLFAEKAEESAKLSEKVARLRKRELLDRLKQIDDSYSQKLERMQAQAALMNGKPGYDQICNNVSVVANKDASVLGLLQEYRARLIRKFGADTIIHLENRQTMDAAGFAALPIGLYRC